MTTATPSFGLTLSSEEHPPGHLVELARRAEEIGFDFVSISDHYHPWVEAQGHSPFVWSVLGAIAASTDELGVGVGVTCPTMRIHPAVVAQAVATTACLLGPRFTWGVGSGEALNEHITGDRWPPAPTRIDMLTEAVDVIRQLLTGESITHHGEHYTVEDARLFDLPDHPVPIVMSAFGPVATRRAAEVADGLWIVGPARDTIEHYHGSGGDGPIWAQLTLAWDPDTDAAVDRAVECWPNSALPGQLAQDLRTVEHFEQAVRLVDRDRIADAVPCGPDLQPTIDATSALLEAGATHVYYHQIGDPTDGFLDVWTSELGPAVRALA